MSEAGTVTGTRPEIGRWITDTLLPAQVRPGTEPWRWAAISARALRVVLGVSLAVAGTGLAGMGIGLTLHGLAILRLDLSQSDAEVLAVGFGVLMIGSALLGLSVEGAFRSPSIRPDAAAWETVAPWLPALLVSLWVVERLESLAARVLLPLSDLLELVPAYLDQVGNRGLLAGLVGIALTWPTLQYAAPRYRLVGANIPALLYACWMAVVLVTYQSTGIG